MMKDDDLEPLLFVGGAHLATEHGHTIDEISELGFKITGTFDYLLNSDVSMSLAVSTGLAEIQLAHLFENHQFDMVCVLGDRFERLPIINNAILFRKPIIHLHGGEVTEGVIDDQIRHMITKAAHLHFVICDDYAKNIRAMGEPAWRIHNTGSLAVDRIVQLELQPKEAVFSELGLHLDKPLAILTYHPVTLEFGISAKDQIRNLFSALDQFEMQVVVTAPGVEVNRNDIVNTIEEYVSARSDYMYVASLGTKKYFSLLSCSEFVIGNSSSGIIEAPYFKVPTVNIGDRQRGRVRHDSIIDTEYSVESIAKGIQKAMSTQFRRKIERMTFKFGDGSSAEKMIDIIKSVKIDPELLRKRLDFEASRE